MENTSDSFMPGSLLFCIKSKKSVCYSVADNSIICVRNVRFPLMGSFTMKDAALEFLTGTQKRPAV